MDRFGVVFRASPVSLIRNSVLIVHLFIFASDPPCGQVKLSRAVTTSNEFALQLIKPYLAFQVASAVVPILSWSLHLPVCPFVSLCVLSVCVAVHVYLSVHLSVLLCKSVDLSQSICLCLYLRSCNVTFDLHHLSVSWSVECTLVADKEI